jgi:RNA polymerase sigma factor (sigma-70 family)
VGAHSADLELARLCAEGDEHAWERFVREYRPVLYRAADALDRTQGAREIADALYADLYGVTSGTGERRSLFRYYQGRSSLATWLRAVLAQRYVDHLRARRRLEPLPDEDLEPLRSTGAHPPARSGPADPDRARYMALMQQALSQAVARLSHRDRLRLGCYYVQQLTLAETGRLLKEHEATVSRQLARTRRAMREDVERQLRDEIGLNDGQMALCFETAASDPGPLDLTHMLSGRKESAPDRSYE